MAASFQANEPTSPSGTRSHIGLIYAKGVFSYASIIAIMRSGNVHVPLNGKLPAERLLKMINDADLAAVVVDAHSGHDGHLIR